jgi:hypothetical protein
MEKVPTKYEETPKTNKIVLDRENAPSYKCNRMEVGKAFLKSR